MLNLRYPAATILFLFCFSFCKIKIFEKIKLFCAFNLHKIAGVKIYQISNKLYYVQTAKVLNSKDVSC